MNLHTAPTPMERLYACQLPKSDKAIADHFGVSTCTVKKSLQRLRDKWHCKNRTELALELAKRGLITPCLLLAIIAQGIALDKQPIRNQPRTQARVVRLTRQQKSC